MMFPNSCRLPRVCLQRINYWGADDDDTMQAKFDLAYDHFKAFLKSHRIKCSQPPFKTWMVAKHISLVQQVLSIPVSIVEMNQQILSAVTRWFLIRYLFVVINFASLRSSKKEEMCSSRRRPSTGGLFLSGSMGAYLTHYPAPTNLQILMENCLCFLHVCTLV